MSVKLFYAPPSPPSRLVRVAAEALGVELDLHLVDMAKGEHLSADFLKINPQHTVPVLVDDDLTINESRAIITYLADKYGKDDTLYPKCIKKRALVNQRLYFDAGTLFQRFADLYYPMFFGGAPLDEEKKKKLDEAFGILEQFLEKTRCVAGDDYTLADITIAVTVSTVEAVGYDISPYSSVAAWLAKAKTSLPGYKVNQEGLEAFKQMVEYLTSKH